MFNKLWIRLKLSFCCVCVMILTASLIGVFYIATFIRRLFMKTSVSDAPQEDVIDEAEDVIGSAHAHLNAIKASLEKQSS